MLRFLPSVCGTDACTVSKLYDQSGKGNDLTVAKKGCSAGTASEDDYLLTNINSAVDATMLSACLDRVLAQVDVAFSNSMVEAFWRSLKHQWLYLNSPDSMAWLRAPGQVLGGAAQDPDATCGLLGTDARRDVLRHGYLPAELAGARGNARDARLAGN